MKHAFGLSAIALSLSTLLTACSENKAEEQSLDDVFTSASPSSLLPEVSKELRITPTANGALNEEAPIPSQCYTKTEGVHNPCYTCHQSYPRGDDKPYRANLRDDGANQGIYTFSEAGESNSWSNLFVDRRHWIDQISDEAILKYIGQDNYSSLASDLKKQNWQGFIPDLENYHLAGEAFDERGFAKDGSGWVAFNYKPFPGTFWPTNGATDDVLIRLPERFQNLDGKYHQDLYLLNLSIVEMTIKGLTQIEVFPIDETRLGLDINADGQYSDNVSQLVLSDHYLGDAADIAVTRQQYPQGTEIMHSVRYVGVNEAGNIHIPKRMKELRYMAKTKIMSDADIDNAYRRERKEKIDEQLPYYSRVSEKGFNNKFGWLIQGYIEDYDGKLRPQSYEEEFFCMGCHAAIGTTIDQTFAFPRKITGKNGWGYIDLKGMKDVPSFGQTEGEILQYLRLNGGGNEFRENDEMFAKWYKEDGSLDEQKVKTADVYELITPSKERALKLNKAYTQIVRTQSFIHGRDTNIAPAINVYKEIDESIAPLNPEHRFDGWDIRLIDWK
ncbi:hypothetical protein P2G88_07385 [Aliiglaciecola sp. CAU 1673]|uniref:hypothetical protein n=1 Tax=Aliiglaciecola sp. CAU 1673 TaxID=3032595 RepID=UPI0023DC6F7C|nr:hypothetical protein [Aliiglaciecola sp. CAU 1673]MDF2178073.1 hypothetical protein [Aliiglaciecola sp. CAU 1673]